ncbi:hypothetical protein KIPB_007541 [Kipferlia bialata]|uniref:Uncharacterized protein n=1 Tax=Kipferlia bialata TaxID=797122 RepID=A0A9K3D1C9_9EUKA|nr:hypothetical protein KIPB_007541 [Kipferlia bialata]|eukprot:g7541.t1
MEAGAEALGKEELGVEPSNQTEVVVPLSAEDAQRGEGPTSTESTVARLIYYTVARLRRERDQALAESEGLRKRVATLSSGHRDQYNTFQGRITMVRLEKDRVRSRASKFQTRLAESEAQVGQLQQERESQKQEIATRDTQIEELQKDVAWERERKEREREAAVEAEGERDSLRTELESLASEYEASGQLNYKKKFDEANDTGLRLRRERDGANKKVTALKKSLAQAQEEIAKLKRDKVHLRQTIGSWREQRHNLRVELDAANEELAYFEDQAQREREPESESERG